MHWSHSLLAACACSLVLTCSCNGQQQFCFDPDDPCPNDMVTDESGCVWDQCSGEFTGNLIPCWWADPALQTADFTLGGPRSQYIVYTRFIEEFAMEYLGQVWLYDLETGEHRQITEDGKMCYRPAADGDRVAWLEAVEYSYEPGVGLTFISDVHVKDLATGQEWHVPNPDEAESSGISISGDNVAFDEMLMGLCEDGQWSTIQSVWVYDLQANQKKLVAAAEMGVHNVGGAELSGIEIVYWEMPSGVCAHGRHPYRLYHVDLDSGDKRMVADFGLLNLPIGGVEWLFNFDGEWAVVNRWSHLEAWNVHTSESVEVTPCYTGGCHNYLSNGFVAFDRSDESGPDQWQVYVVEIATGREQQITTMRPYYDSASPISFLGHRLLWAEGRGRTAYDDCGGERLATGKTSLFFWKDIEF